MVDLNNSLLGPLMHGARLVTGDKRGDEGRRPPQLRGHKLGDRSAKSRDDTI